MERGANNIRVISMTLFSGLFLGLENLKELYICASITPVGQGLLKGLVSLTRLEVRGSTFSGELVSGALSGIDAPLLTYLIFWGTKFKGLQPSAVGDFPKVKELSLLSSQFEPMLAQDASFNGFPNVTHFDVMYWVGPFRAFAGFTSVLSIEYASDYFTLNSPCFQARSFEGFPNLETMTVGTINNPFAPDAFVGLTKLRSMTLHRLPLHSMTADMFNGLERLESLTFQYSEWRWSTGLLQTWEDECGIPRVAQEPRVLVYGTDEGILLPANVLSRLVGLKSLNVQVDQISEPHYRRTGFVLTSRFLGGLQSLQELVIRNGPGTRIKLLGIESGAFQHVGNLSKLDLSGSRLAGGDQDGLEPYSNSIEPGAFYGLRNLRTLDLSNCNLCGSDNCRNVTEYTAGWMKMGPQGLVADSFRDMENLEELDLSSNNIAVLERNVFDSLVNLAHVNLGGNRAELTCVATAFSSPPWTILGSVPLCSQCFREDLGRECTEMTPFDQADCPACVLSVSAFDHEVHGVRNCTQCTRLSLQDMTITHFRDTFSTGSEFPNLLELDLS
eukprot:3940657-Rhodomonas_salina.1